MKIKSISTFLATMISLMLVITGCAGTAITRQASQNLSIPLLDKEIHAKIETATFALG